MTPSQITDAAIESIYGGYKRALAVIEVAHANGREATTRESLSVNSILKDCREERRYLIFLENQKQR